MEMVTSETVGTINVVEICDVDQLWDGEMACFLAGDTNILLVKINERFHAYQPECPHQRAALVDGELAGGRLICPAHRWTFDATNGQGVNPRSACLKRFPVHAVGQKIFVELERNGIEAAPMPPLRSVAAGNGVPPDDG